MVRRRRHRVLQRHPDRSRVAVPLRPGGRHLRRREPFATVERRGPAGRDGHRRRRRRVGRDVRRGGGRRFDVDGAGASVVELPTRDVTCAIRRPRSGRRCSSPRRATAWATRTRSRRPARSSPSRRTSAAPPSTPTPADRRRRAVLLSRRAVRMRTARGPQGPRDIARPGQLCWGRRSDAVAATGWPPGGRGAGGIREALIRDRAQESRDRRRPHRRVARRGRRRVRTAVLLSAGHGNAGRPAVPDHASGALRQFGQQRAERPGRSRPHEPSRSTAPRAPPRRKAVARRRHTDERGLPGRTPPRRGAGSARTRSRARRARSGAGSRRVRPSRRGPGLPAGRPARRAACRSPRGGRSSASGRPRPSRPCPPRATRGPASRARTARRAWCRTGRRRESSSRRIHRRAPRHEPAAAEWSRTTGLTLPNSP